MTIEKTIPVLRIFDYTKAVEFYVDWLGFKINWEHTYEEDMPIYMEVERDGLVLHLSEHHGDGTPGSNVFVWCKGVADFHRQLRKYKYNRPGLQKDASEICFRVIDPFHNIISFNERIEEK